jgi:hypothetical protein
MPAEDNEQEQDEVRSEGRALKVTVPDELCLPLPPFWRIPLKRVLKMVLQAFVRLSVSGGWVGGGGGQEESSFSSSISMNR